MAVVLMTCIVFTLIQTLGPNEEVAAAGSIKAAEETAATEAEVVDDLYTFYEISEQKDSFTFFTKQ